MVTRNAQAAVIAFMARRAYNICPSVAVSVEQKPNVESESGKYENNNIFFNVSK